MSKTSKDTTSTKTDPALMALYTNNYNRASGIANTPYTPFSGQLVTTPSDTTKQAQGLLSAAPGVGSDTINSGIMAALKAASNNPQQVNSNIQAPTISTAQSDAPQTINPATVGYQNANAAQIGNVALATAPKMAEAGQGYASSINPNSISTVNAQTGLGNLSGYMNPYTQDVTNATMNQIDQLRQRAVNQDASNAALGNSVGGSREGVMQSLTNENYGLLGAQTLANLNSQGFNTSAGLLQNDQNRNLQGQLANQSTGLDLNKNNANNATQVSMNNANLATQAAMQKAALDAGVSTTNAGALNAAGTNNAGFQQQTNLTNAGAANSALSQGAGYTQAANMANASNALQNSQFNASSANQIGTANAGNALTAAQLGLQGQVANQGAGLTGNAQALSAAGLLGNLGTTQQQNYLTGAGAVSAAGAQQDATSQANLDAAYQQWLQQQNYPFMTQGLLNSSLGMIPNQSTTTQTKTPGIMDYLGTIATGAGAFLSDARMKDNVKTAFFSKGRRWVTFHYKWEPENVIHMGVIAQEVAKTDPDAVVQGSDGYLRVNYAKLREAA